MLLGVAELIDIPLGVGVLATKLSAQKVVYIAIVAIEAYIDAQIVAYIDYIELVLVAERE